MGARMLSKLFNPDRKPNMFFEVATHSAWITICNLRLAQPNKNKSGACCAPFFAHVHSRVKFGFVETSTRIIHHPHCCEQQQNSNLIFSSNSRFRATAIFFFSTGIDSSPLGWSVVVGCRGNTPVSPMSVFIVRQ